MLPDLAELVDRNHVGLIIDRHVHAAGELVFRHRFFFVWSLGDHHHVPGRANVFQTTHHLVLQAAAERHDDDHGHDADDDAQQGQNGAQFIRAQAACGQVD